MPGTHYFWDMDRIPVPYLERRSVGKVIEKLRAKFGNGPMVAVGDENRMKENDDPEVAIKSVPLLEFIHVPYSQKNAAAKILLQSITERIWARGDVIVLLTADGTLTKDIMVLKSQGVTINLIGNRLNELYIRLQEVAGRSYVFQWSEILGRQ
uniref:NYN domain-containing protein n=1 Tax=Plectus sambesii TaxID=2011161 RepID=A0A914VQW2_9BILA